MDSILQWNVRGLRANYEELILLCNNFKPSVVALQECKLSTALSPPRGYHFFHRPTPNSAGDVGLLVNKGNYCSQISLNLVNLEAVAVRVSNLVNKTISVCSLYLKPDKPIPVAELDDLVNQLPKPFLILGDFNAHSPLWGDSRQDHRGTVIEKLISNHDLFLFNSGAQTFLHSAYGTFSAIDLSIASPSLALDFGWKVHNDLCGSDHFPIVLSSTSKNSENSSSIFNLKKTNWTAYKNLCLSNITPEILDSDDPVSVFTSKILDIANACIPKLSIQSKRLPRTPWFTAACSEAIKNRKKAYRKFNRQPTLENLLLLKKTKAKARQTIRAAKKTSWRKYVSTMTEKISSQKVWRMIRKIKGKNANQTKSHLKSTNALITNEKDIANCLGQRFSKVSSNRNYLDSFRTHKNDMENRPLRFESNNSESYNALFTLQELRVALSKANPSAPGQDNIHYQFLSNLPTSCQKILLDIFNHIWISSRIPESWKKANIIPIPKPGKDHTDPSNYRPIALTSCLCKTMERMVNDRLVWVLESQNHLAKVQCGFRKNHSTVDHLVRLESCIREAFARKKQVLAIFFDLEKAYDTTWRHGILSDLHDLDFRGRLPLFIKDFLSDRNFQVKINQTLSDSFSQEAGVPQGSILSPILFNVKLNNIVKSVRTNANTSLFVDDFAIYIEGKYLPHLERSMQLCVDQVNKWVTQNGFKFSIDKTVCVHFHRQRNLHQEPNIVINTRRVKVSPTAKFLGLTFDSKLSFIPHIKALKLSCLKALDILRVVGHTDWGADRTTLLRLYRSLIRSKLDYGSIVYGSAPEYALKLLDTIHHQGLRIALGAFRTSPVKSLYVEAEETSLKHRRIKLSMNYLLKLKSLPENPAYDCVFNGSPSEIFETSKSTPPFGVRTLHHASQADIRLRDIDCRRTETLPPWRQPKIEVDLTLDKFKKDETNNLVYQQEFLDLKEKYRNFQEIYTDGSKKEEKTGAAIYCPSDPDKCCQIRLKDNTSVFNAELEGFLMALKTLNRHQKSNLVLYTDSLSALQALLNPVKANGVVHKILNLIELLSRNCRLCFVWIPGHAGIKGNEKVDHLAKSALQQPVNRNYFSIYSDFKPLVKTYIQRIWQEDWDTEINNKLHEIIPNLNEKPPSVKLPRKEETIMHRLRIGHTWLTHCFILKKEPLPICVSCNTNLSVKHILLECTDFDQQRTYFYNKRTLYDLFRDIEPNKILGFLKLINFYNKL